MVDEIVRVAVDHGIWGVVTLLVVIASRSRPARELSRVVTKEIRWRYLRAKGFSKKELHKMLLNDWEDEDNHRTKRSRVPRWNRPQCDGADPAQLIGLSTAPCHVNVDQARREEGR